MVRRPRPGSNKSWLPIVGLNLCSKYLLIGWNARISQLTKKELDKKVAELSVLQNQPKPNLTAIKQVEEEIAL